MAFFIEGIKIGVVLALMIGPLFFTLIQTGIEEGFRAGTMVGLGIWVSDFLYVLAVYGGLSYLVTFVENKAYTQPVGIAGSALLVLFGLTSLLATPKNRLLQDEVLRISSQRSSTYISLWLKGFLINTINPFTVFFWFGLMSTIAVRDDFKQADARYFFAGILMVVILSDMLKVFLAKQIRLFMRPVHIVWLRRITGIALLVFGVALLIRVVW